MVTIKIRKRRINLWICIIGILFSFPDFEDDTVKIDVKKERIILDLINIIYTKRNIKVRKAWTLYDIEKTAIEIKKIEKELKIHRKKQYATIEIESEFYPRTLNRNTDKSYDIGLTQQNTCCIQDRCIKEFGRRCKTKELFVPWISIRLMKQRFIECRHFKGKLKFLCYNSTRKARNKTGKYLKIWEKHFEKIKNLKYRYK